MVVLILSNKFDTFSPSHHFFILQNFHYGLFRDYFIVYDCIVSSNINCTLRKRASIKCNSEEHSFFLLRDWWYSCVTSLFLIIIPVTLCKNFLTHFLTPVTLVILVTLCNNFMLHFVIITEWNGTKYPGSVAQDLGLGS